MRPAGPARFCCEQHLCGVDFLNLEQRLRQKSFRRLGIMSLVSNPQEATRRGDRKHDGNRVKEVLKLPNAALAAATFPPS